MPHVLLRRSPCSLAGGFFATLVACVACLGALAPLALAAFPGHNGKIAFIGETHDDYINPVFTVYPDGSQPAWLTHPSFTDYARSWSPDGSKLMYDTALDDETSGPTKVINADGTNVIQPFPTNAVGQDWSPDGTKYLYSFGGGLWTMNLNGSNQTQVTSQGGGADWSPNGAKIAFLRAAGATGALDIFTVNPDGSGLANITSTPTDETTPDWSPDSSKIVFGRGLTYAPNEIWTMNGNGTQQTLIKSNGAMYSATPAWSPDGTQIAYADGSQIWVMNTDGSGEHSIYPGRGPIDWQPCPAACPPPPQPGYDHPRLVRGLAVRLVPNFRQTISDTQCQARGGTPSGHGPPLAFSSCNPPGFVPGTVAHMGSDPSYGGGHVQLAVRLGDAAPGDLADVLITSYVGDVRSSTGSDYTGGVTLAMKLRFTDTYNGPSLADPATVSDVEIRAGGTCAVQGAPSPPGSSCNINTNLDALAAGTIREGKNTVMQTFRVRMNDAGPDGVSGNADDRIFATQGIYIP